MSIQQPAFTARALTLEEINRVLRLMQVGSVAGTTQATPSSLQTGAPGVTVATAPSSPIPPASFLTVNGEAALPQSRRLAVESAVLTLTDGGNLSSLTIGTKAFSGDATSPINSFVLTLAATGVTAGAYGDATHIPTFTVDAKGRLTLASTSAAAVVPQPRLINTSAPLTGGGDLTADRTIAFSNQAANTFLAGPTTGAPAYPTFRAIVAGDLPGSFSGFANPTASVGLTAVNGAATTAMRSDAAPPLSQAITPTWTGLHTYSVIPIVGTEANGDNSTHASSTAYVDGIGTALGDMLYWSASGTRARLAGPISATKQFLTSTGTGAAANAPVWGTIVASDLPGSFSGFANPTAVVGLTAVNGVATTAMRSDAAPALDQTIAPTWSGLHIWTATMTASVTTTQTTASPSVSGFACTLTSNPASASSANLRGITANAVIQSGNAQTHSSLQGLLLSVTHGGTNTLTSAVGTFSSLTFNNTGNTTAAYGFRADCTISNANTVGTYRGMFINAPSVSGGGAITTLLGLDIGAMTAGGTNRAIRTSTGIVELRDTTDSTSTSTGAVISLGGFGITKSIVAGLGITGNTSNDFTAVSNIPTWLKVTLTFSSFSAAATTNSITLASLVAGGVIHAVKIKQSASFTGGTITAYTVSVGVSGNLLKYASAFDVFQAPGNTVFQFSNSVGTENHGAATTILATATSTGANLNAATAGSVDIWLLVSKAV